MLSKHPCVYVVFCFHEERKRILQKNSSILTFCLPSLLCLRAVGFHGVITDIRALPLAFPSFMSLVKTKLKPWITYGILNSVNKRHRLVQNSFLSNDLTKVKAYNTYNNKLYKIKFQAKKQYFYDQFSINKGNMKLTWKLLDILVTRKQRKRTVTSNLLYNNHCFNGQVNICSKLNKYFVNDGSKLASELPKTNIQPSNYIKSTFQNKFVFRGICTEKVIHLTNSNNHLQLL